MQSRPVFLNLLKIRLPIPGILSILHRLSGVLLVFTMPLIIWLLGKSLVSVDEFAMVNELLTGSLYLQLAIALIFWSLAHHILAGIRFLIIDLGFGLGKNASIYSSLFLLVLSAAIFVFLLSWVFL